MSEFFEKHPLVTVVQDGSRLHYALPISLQLAGALERVYCDWYSAVGTKQEKLAKILTALNKNAGRKLASRYVPLLDPGRIFTHPSLILKWAAGGFLLRPVTKFWEWQSHEVFKWVARSGFGDSNILAGFARNIHPHLLDFAADRGLVTVTDQIIAPATEELRQAQLQRQRWPDWEPEFQLDIYKHMADLEQRTWMRSSHITCASEYVKNTLVANGIESSRISIAPYPIDSAPFRAGRASTLSGPLTVGFVGRVELRKGAPYFIEVARRLRGQGIRFVMVGPISLTDKALQRSLPWVEFTGAVPRPNVSDWLKRFDVFLFPSTCEGSAGVLMEAMASGLPVITSPNSGSIVRDGHDGFVRDYDDIDGMTECLLRLNDERAFLLEMGNRAAQCASLHDLSGYAKSLFSIYNRVLNRHD